MKVGVVDYDAGNLRSVETALSYLGFDATTAADPEPLESSDVLIVPGVGEAATAMARLRERNLDSLIRNHAASGKRLVGICLGLHLFVESTEERDTRCLELLPGRVVRFPASKREKVPHMGWNQLRRTKDAPLFEGVPDNRSFYFVHSYYLEPAGARDSMGITDYMTTFVSVVAHDNVAAFQFHPEKSGLYGLRLLRNAISGELC